MDKIQYVGEALWIGYLCKAFIIGGFVAALFSAVSYTISSLGRDDQAQSWKRLGNIGFAVHALLIISLLGLMFYAMVNQHYEYSYVFDHVSGDLPMKYILSAFWEGQEGSFLLWMFWHLVIGAVIISINDPFKLEVMAVIMVAEIWLNSMLLGIYLPFGEDLKIGSNPMMLIREITLAPIFNNADYLSLIQGRGLNPLLQNYWMTIHPPFIFAAFALSVVPFGYAVAALRKGEYQDWLRPVLPWALFGTAILGISLIMGSLWAYEALSFGGYWAWDPVENTSLVPWIVLVGGIHANLIAKATGRAVRSTLLFYLGGFLMIVYSTLLTRSGILGDTSAHAFTEMGLEWQLTFFLLSFLFLGMALMVWRHKNIHTPAKEESIYSREFWMYVGSLILFFSALLINASSSLPVLNTILRYFDPSYIGRVIKDPIAHYNKYQLWISIFIGLFSAITVWLKYKNSEPVKKKWLVRISVYTAAAVLLTWLTSLWIQLPEWHYLLMGATAWFTIVANGHFLIEALTRNLRAMGAALAHVGFGIMAIGILASGLNFSYLSNPFVFKGLFGGEGDEEKYIQLIKNKPLLVKDYVVTYEADTLIGKARHYDISFKQLGKDSSNRVFIDSFVTRPNAVYSNDFSKVAAFNPDTRHYAGKDIFTCVVSLPAQVADAEQAKLLEDSLKYQSLTAFQGDSIRVGKEVLVIDGLQYPPLHEEFKNHTLDVGFEVAYHIIDENGQKEKGQCAIGLEGSLLYKFAGKHENLGWRVRPAEQLLDQWLSPEDQLDYSVLSLKKGQQINWQGYTFNISGFDKNVDTSRYKADKNDISIMGLVDVKKGAKSWLSKPIFVLRGNAPMSIKDYLIEEGLHIRLSAIDPATGTFELKIAKDKRNNPGFPLEIATNVPRSDYIVLEAKIFPGINLYWVGSILMMIGLLMAWWFKYKENKAWTSAS